MARCGEVEVEVARFRARELAIVSERLRVALHRWLDRTRLAHQALCAGQQEFADMHGAAADAHAAVVRDLRARLHQLERRHAARRVRSGHAGPR